MRRTLVASIGAIALSTAAVTGVMAGSREASTWEGFMLEGSTLEAFILEAFVREGSTPAAFIREPFTRAVCVREDWQ